MNKSQPTSPEVSQEIAYVSSMIRAKRNAIIFGLIVFLLVSVYYGESKSGHPELGSMLFGALLGMPAGFFTSLVACRIFLILDGVPAEYRGSYAFWEKIEQPPIAISIPRTFKSDKADVLNCPF